MTTSLIGTLISLLGKHSRPTTTQDASEEDLPEDKPLDNIIATTLNIDEVLGELNDLGVSDLNTIRDYIVDEILGTLPTIDDITDWIENNAGTYMVSPVTTWVTNNAGTVINTPITTWINNNIKNVVLGDVVNDIYNVIKTSIKNTSVTFGGGVI